MLGFIIVSSLIFTFYCGIELLIRGTGSEILQFTLKLIIHNKGRYGELVNNLHEHKDVTTFVLPRMFALAILFGAYLGFYSFFFAK